MMKRSVWKSVLLLGLFWTAAASAAWAQQPPSVASESDLVLAVGDTVEIEVERHEKYSGLFPIEAEGTINHPLVGPVAAKGLTLEALQESLTEQFSRYIRRPMLKVSLAEPEEGSASRVGGPTVYLMGEVRKPGPYELTPGMRLIQLIALSGGPILHPMEDHLGNIRSTGANLRNISIFRADGETVQVDLEHIQQTGDQSQNLVLEPGDTVYVPAGTRGEFTILGQVRYPGSYPVKEKMNLMEALVEAGGFTRDGSLRNIRIVRADSPDPQTFRVNLWDTLKGGRLEMIPEIQAGDAIFVEHTPFYHWERFVSMIRGAAISSESVRVIRDFDERTGGRVYYR